jgi:PhnB protein
MNAAFSPRLVVRRADAALEFYQRAFDAVVTERLADEEGTVVRAAFTIGAQTIVLTEERREWNHVSPESLGGSPVILDLVVDDVDAVAKRLKDAGAEVVFPVADQFYGHRAGRFRDPFGHLWIVTTVIEKLTPEEISERMRRQ